MTVVDGPIDYVLPGKDMTNNICYNSYCDYVGPYYASLAYILLFSIIKNCRKGDQGTQGSSSNIMATVKIVSGGLILLYSSTILLIMRQNVIENQIGAKKFDTQKTTVHLFILVFMTCIICSMVVRSLKSVGHPTSKLELNNFITKRPTIFKALYTIIPGIILYFTITLFFGISFLDMKGEIKKDDEMTGKIIKNGDKLIGEKFEIAQCNGEGFLNILYEPLAITILIMTVTNFIINFTDQKINNIYYIILITSVLITMTNKLSQTKFTCIF